MALLAPENDYRPLRDVERAASRLAVTIVIPVYNRVGLLQLTLAGLGAQRGYPDDLIDVVVVDDGSEEDVAAGLAESALPYPVTLLHQEHDGYGAGRARNRGVREAAGDVVLFVDADCLPDPGLVAAHMGWHRRDDGVVVIGSRHGLDTTGITAADLASGAVDLRNRTFGHAPDEADLAPNDWRRTLYRRTNRLVHGTEAYRAVVSSNVSMRRDLFLAVGGFTAEFRHWGGEDTELGWRLWNHGALLVPEDAAIVYHQTQQDGGADGWRRTGRVEGDPLIVDLIPHRFYRKDVTTAPHPVPKVSWVVSPAAGKRSPELLGQLAAQRVADWEAFFPHDPDPGGDSRLRRLPDATGSAGHRFLRAVAAARGEYVAVLSGAAAPDPLLLDRTIRLLDRVQRASLATVAAHATDHGAADTAWGAYGMPAFALARRREWAKVLRTESDPEAAWRRIRDLSRARKVDEALVTLPDPAPTVPASVVPVVSGRTRAAETARTGGPIRRLVYALAQRVLRRRSRAQADDRPVIAHFGDERSLAALRDLAPWASVVAGGDRAAAIVIGGGVDLDGPLLERVTALDTPRVERAVLGATAVPDEWRDFAATCAALGVGPDAAAALRGWGLEVETVRHPADDPEGAAPVVAALREAMS